MCGEQREGFGARALTERGQGGLAGCRAKHLEEMLGLWRGEICIRLTALLLGTEPVSGRSHSELCRQCFPSHGTSIQPRRNL